MTVLKIQGKPNAAAMSALQPHVQRMYDSPGRPWVAILELTQAERTEPAPASDKDHSVVMRIIGAEIATGELEQNVRDVMHALYVMRTSYGTLTEEHDIALSKQTIADAGGDAMLTLIARLSAGITHWTDYLLRVTLSSKLTMQEVKHEIDAAREGLLSLLNRQSTLEIPEDPAE